MATLTSVLGKLSHIFSGLNVPFGFPSFPVDEDFDEALRRDMERDARALASDWEQVGQDMRRAMDSFYTHHMDDSQRAQLLEILEANPTTQESAVHYKVLVPAVLFDDGTEER
ncbi:MAG: hypothetical protein GDA54_06110 [Alphaproteobacteria bacterium GM7ARS4]|nr:hypothetical protein [Alphaproteobacteria bacterium GM7ARS4]